MSRKVNQPLKPALRRAEALRRNEAVARLPRVSPMARLPCLWRLLRGQVPLALFLLEKGADPNVADAGLTPLHWASSTWENGTANPVYGFDDPMAGFRIGKQSFNS